MKITTKTAYKAFIVLALLFIAIQAFSTAQGLVELKAMQLQELQYTSEMNDSTTAIACKTLNSTSTESFLSCMYDTNYSY